MTWIDEVLKCTSESEAPERYFWWSAICTISAITRRKIYLSRGGLYRLYPNVYVVLVGPSGLRKGNPIDLSKKLVDRVDNTKLISGRSSIEAVIRELGKVYTTESKNQIVDATCFLISSELTAMLVENEYAPGILMDLYDSHFHDKWRNILISRAPDKLKNVFITMFAATNETNLSFSWPKSAVNGGLVARTHIILEEKKRRLNALVQEVEFKPDIEKLSKRLFEIANLKGNFIFDSGVGPYFENWYHKFMTLESLDKTGTLDRLPDSALKVAMCISLSEKDDLVLTKDNVEEAIQRSLECIIGMKKVFLGTGEHSLVKPTTFLIRYLIKQPKHEISRRRILSELYGQADAIDLDRIVDTLVQSGTLEIIKGDVEQIYKLTDSVIDKYESLKEEEK